MTKNEKYFTISLYASFSEELVKEGIITKQQKKIIHKYLEIKVEEMQLNNKRLSEEQQRNIKKRIRMLRKMWL